MGFLSFGIFDLSRAPVADAPAPGENNGVLNEQTLNTPQIPSTLAVQPDPRRATSQRVGADPAQGTSTRLTVALLP